MKEKTAKLFVFIITIVSILLVQNAKAQSLPFLEDFSDNTLGEMTSYSVSGDQQWQSNSYGYTPPCGYISGYSGDFYANADWLITPALDFSSISSAILEFDEAINYTGAVENEQEIFISTDYSGSGDPSSATWTELNITGRSTGDNWNWYTVDACDLSDYVGESSVYIGFKYTSTTSVAGTWEIDNISITEGSIATPPQIDNITLSPLEPTSSDAVSISATITDNDGTIQTAVLHWGETFLFGNEIEMSKGVDDTWTTVTEIPAYENNTQIFYKIVAIDNESNQTETESMTYFVNDPYNGEFPFYEPFNYDLGEMSAISVTGDQLWIYDENYGNGYAKMSGYSGGNNVNEDWLITPMLDFTDLTEAKLVFNEAINYAGIIDEEQEVYISIDFIDDVTSATWTKLTVTGRASGSDWTYVEVDTIDLSAYLGEPSIFIGFKYTSTTTEAATWEIDDVKVEGAVNPEAPHISNIIVSPDNPTSSDAINVSADVIDDQSNLSTVTLNWGTVSGELNTSINMSVSSGDTYTIDTDIPAQPNGTTVYYRILAEDDLGNSKTTAEMPIDVVDYGTKLVIKNVSPSEPYVGQQFSIEVEVHDDLGNIANVDQDTEIQINQASGTGIISGTATAVINSETNNVTISGLVYDISETFEVNVSVNSGMSLISSENSSISIQTRPVVSLPFTEDFAGNTFGDLTKLSVQGDQQWEIVPDGNPELAAQISGFSGGNNTNEDWMITPGIDLSNITEAKLVFDELINYSNVIENEQEILVSTNYFGNPSEASWTELSVTGRSEGNDDYFVTVNDVDLSSYAGEPCIHVAFKYSSSDTYSARWKIDNIVIEEGPTEIAPIISNITHMPVLPSSSDAVSVSAEITDIDGTVGTVVLHWGLTDLLGNEITMILSSGSTWVSESDIPAQNANDTIYFKIVAIDDDLISSESDTLSYIVFNPYAGNLPFYEPFYNGLGVMEQISLIGEQTWSGEEIGDINFASISGFGNGNSVANQDWLITPAIDLSEVNTATLNFSEAINLTGDTDIVVDDTHEVFISTDYSGDPVTASWTELTITGREPQDNGWLWVDIDEVNIDEYAGESTVYIAFRYQSTDNTNSTWEIDNIKVEGAYLYGPIIENIVLDPANPTSIDDVYVYADITDPDGSIDTAIFYYGTHIDSLINASSMSISQLYTYVSDNPIHMPHNGLTFYYQIKAIDNDGIETLSTIMSFTVNDPTSVSLPYLRDFETGDLYTDGWNTQILSGDHNWTIAQESGNKYAYVDNINGIDYDNCEVWYVSPEVDLTTAVNPVVEYRSASYLQGSQLKLKISTDYTNDVTNCTWIELLATWSNGDWNWNNSGKINIADFNGEGVYIAFQFIGEIENGNAWKIDDFSIQEGTSIINTSINNLTIYPNPAQNEVFVTGVENISNVEIISLDGKVVMSEQTNNNRIDVSSVNGGMYIIRVISGNEVYTTRFVKK